MGEFVNFWRRLLIRKRAGRCEVCRHATGRVPHARYCEPCRDEKARASRARFRRSPKYRAWLKAYRANPEVRERMREADLRSKERKRQARKSKKAAR